MTPWPPHVYRTDGDAEGVPPDVLAHAVDQVHRVQSVGLPAVLTLNHLAVQSDVPYSFLRSIVERREAAPYRYFSIHKRAGGRRLICVPHPLLLNAQKWIARHILRAVAAHPASFAYSRGNSILSCARLHCRCRWLIKIDVRQFFESISERQVYYAFRSLGYQPLVSFEMARICTRIHKSDFTKYADSRWRNEQVEGAYRILLYSHRFVGHLPQGAPTSPMLSNLAMASLDRTLASYASATGTVFTRYADDIVFSTASGSFSRRDAEGIVRDVYRELRAVGLRPHTAKTLISPPGSRKVVLGLLVDSESPRLLRSFRKKLEQHLYCLERFGPVVHAQQRGFNSIFAMKLHIKGLLRFATDIDPRIADPLAARFRSIPWPD